MADFYVYGCSTYGSAKYPDNKAFDFIVELPYKLSLEGSWSVAIIDICVYKKEGPAIDVYVCSDSVWPSYTDGYTVGILKRLNILEGSNSIQCTPLQYIQLSQSFNQPTLNITILYDESLQHASVLHKSTRCTLHFKPAL